MSTAKKLFRGKVMISVVLIWTFLFKPLYTSAATSQISASEIPEKPTLIKSDRNYIGNFRREEQIFYLKFKTKTDNRFYTVVAA